MKKNVEKEKRIYILNEVLVNIGYRLFWNWAVPTKELEQAENYIKSKVSQFAQTATLYDHEMYWEIKLLSC